MQARASRTPPPATSAPPDALLDDLDGFAGAALAAGSRLARGLASLPWWVRVGLVWLASRLFALAWTLVALHLQAPVPTLEHPGGYVDYAGIWDGVIYLNIHDNGYPATLPRAADGTVLGSQWAFLPLYPLLVKAVTSLTGLGWPVAATSVSLAASLGFLLVAYRLFRTRADAGTSLAAVAMVAFATASPVLQFAYAESLGLLLVAATLLLATRGHYLRAAPVVVLAGLTRPLGVPLFVTGLVVALAVVMSARRAGERLPARTGWALAAYVVAGAVAAAAWPVYAAVVTGVPDAYLATEASWHGGVRPPLASFLASLVVLLGRAAGTAVAVTVLVGFVALMLSRPARRVGIVLWAWTGSVIGYLVLLTPANSSTPRLLLSAFPLALMAAVTSRDRWYRGLLIAVLAASQVAWLLVLWHLGDGVNDHSP